VTTLASQAGNKISIHLGLVVDTYYVAFVYVSQDKSTSGKSARQEVPHETQHNRGAMFSLRHSDGGGCLMQGCRNTQRCHGLGTPKR